MSQGLESMGGSLVPEIMPGEIHDIDFNNIIAEAGRIAAGRWNQVGEMSVATARAAGRYDTDTCPIPEPSQAAGCQASDDCTVVATCEDVTNEGTCDGNTCEAACDG